MTPTSKHIAVRYHCFRQHAGKEFVIQKIKSKIRRQIFLPRVYKVEYYQQKVVEKFTTSFLDGLNTKPYISFAVHQWYQFTHSTKASNDTAANRIYRYLKGTKYNGLVFNPSKKLVVNFYTDADFAGLWGHENPQDPICDRSRTVLVVKISNFTLLWMSIVQTEIALYTLHYEYVAFSHYVRELLPLKSLIKDVIL